MKKKNTNTEKPATQKNIKLLQEDLGLMGGNLTFQIVELETSVDTLKTKAHSIEKTVTEIKEEQAKQSRVLGSILSVNQAILGQLTGAQKHGDRIENHEERIDKLEVKVRILQK